MALHGSSRTLKLASTKSLLLRLPNGTLRYRLAFWRARAASAHYPAQVPDLIGVKERKYLDHSGLVRHRSIVDMMRYSALNQGADDLASYGGFIPGARDFRTLPDPATRKRYSDEQLYALTLYLYSLKAPANPNKLDGVAARGKEVFEQQRCGVCHPAPLYTNNQLTPAEGFRVPEEHHKKDDILPVVVGTDPYLTLKTRRGTGYYKVPSLKGLWYRGPFEHNGSVATLEDWFDPRRLSEDYVPTGFRGAGVKTRAIKGHLFGLDLSAENRKALVAFLKTPRERGPRSAVFWSSASQLRSANARRYLACDVIDDSQSRQSSRAACSPLMPSLEI